MRLRATSLSGYRTTRGPQPFVLDFSAFTAAQLRDTYGWSRDSAGAATLIDSGGAVRYAPHNLLLNSATLSTQTITTVSGQAYTLSIYGTGSVTLSSGGSGTLAGTGAGDRVSLTFTASGTSTVVTVSGSVTQGQINLGSAALAYVETAGAARYQIRAQDYSGGAAGLLLEGAVTQYSQYTEDFASSTDTTGVTISANAATAPSGSVTADRITPTATVNVHRVIGAPAGTGSATNTYSVFVKPDGYSKISIRESETTGNYVSFDLSTNSVIDASAGCTGRVIVRADGYRRVVATIAAASYQAFGIYVLSPSYSSGQPNDQSWTADGSGGVIVWGRQTQPGASATSYIPNPSTGTMTRAADAAEIGAGATFDSLFPVAMAGANLVLDGDGASIAAWGAAHDAGASAAASGGQIVLTTASGGTAARLRQQVAVTSGRMYRVSCVQTVNNSGAAPLVVWGTNYGVDTLGATSQTDDGAQSFDVQATGSNLYLQLQAYRGDGSVSATFDDVAIRDVTPSGTLVLEWFDVGAKDGDIIALHNGTANEMLALYYTGGSVAVLVKDGGANQLAATLGTPVASGRNKAAISWGASGLAAVLNGGSVQANASGTVPTPTSARFSGSALASASSAAWALVRTTTYADQRTGAELQALTA